uniref:Uncharacterized protein n=1 Tax=Dulem virus 251 TaxID=3145728 RepID=A0AAU8B6F4_9VIRU
MKEIVIDCCELKLAGEQDSRVTFVKHVRSDSSELEYSVVRNHCPLSAAMSIISFDRTFSDGFLESYLIEPERD